MLDNTIFAVSFARVLKIFAIREQVLRKACNTYCEWYNQLHETQAN